jgi:hypothetical protein
MPSTSCGPGSTSRAGGAIGAPARGEEQRRVDLRLCPRAAAQGAEGELHARDDRCRPQVHDQVRQVAQHERVRGVQAVLARDLHHGAERVGHLTKLSS